MRKKLRVGGVTMLVGATSGLLMGPAVKLLEACSCYHSDTDKCNGKACCWEGTDGLCHCKDTSSGCPS
jgi:hypothetical protein